MSKNQLYLICLGAFFLYSTVACNSAKDNLSNLNHIVEELEKQDVASISKNEWINLDEEFKDLEKVAKEGDFSENDQEEFEKLKGRGAALKLKKSMLEWKDDIKDMSNQVEGFVDGIGN